MDGNLYSKLLKDFWLPSVPSSTLFNVLQLIGDENVAVQDVAPAIVANQAYSHMLRRINLIAKRVLEWEAEDAELAKNDAVLTTRILRLLGKGAVRNLITCVSLNRATKTGLPIKPPGKGSDRENKISIAPREQIPFAIAAEEFCLERDIIEPHLSFLAGLHYDWIVGLAQANKSPKDVVNYAGEVFKEGMVVARSAYRLAGRTKSVRLGRFVFAAGVLSPIGKVFQAIGAPKELKEKSWNSFLADMRKKGTRELEALESLEKARFSVTYPELSGIYVSFVKTLSPVEKALGHLRQPYALRTESPDLYALSMLLSLGTLIAAVVLGSGSSVASALKPFQADWLAKSKLSVEDLNAVLSDIKAGKDL